MKNIKSAHIIQIIFSYTDDKLKYKLFSYSKKYQKQLNMGLLDYQVKFFDKIKMNSFNSYFKYLCDPESKYNFNEKSDNDDNNDSDYVSYNKDGKSELLKKDLLKYNINIDDFKNYVKNYFIKYKEKFIKELNEEYKNKKHKIMLNSYHIEGWDYEYNNEELRGIQEFSEGIKLEIDINSPLFDIFYKSKLFGELFIIPIDFQFIKEYKLNEDYINVFIKLNDINSNYSSLYLKCNDDKDISYLKEFNINFNKIKNLIIEIDYSKDKFDYNLFYRELFSLKDIENNIIDLNINNNKYSFIYNNILENLNKFKKLEHLKLNRLRAINIFELNIKTLKTLNIISCGNIYINSNAALSIKKLISYDKISNSLLKLPQLEYLEAIESTFSSIDFNSLNNLKKIKIYLYKEFSKLLSIKNLKEIEIFSDDINYFDLGSINDKNPSVNKLIYRYVKEDNYDIDYNINKILNKFPNLTELIFYANLDEKRWYKNGWDYDDSEVNLEIEEDLSCKINKVTLFLFFGNIKLECQNFENLEKFDITAVKILNISNSIPMFSNNRNVKYNSLIELNLHLKRQLINLEIFKNLNNNIDNMPNLKKIDLDFMANIDRNTYEEFIKKILSLKLEFANIDIKNGGSCFLLLDFWQQDNGNLNNKNYSLEELKIINKNILCLNYENIKIKKSFVKKRKFKKIKKNKLNK